MRFGAGLEEALGGGERVVIEVGPGRGLSRLARRQQTAAGREAEAYASMRAAGEAVEDEEALLGALGGAWLSEIAELDGPAQVRKLYSAKMPAFDLANVSKTLGTNPLELDRKWQMWMYAYLAGMPSASQSMHMNMEMGGQ